MYRYEQTVIVQRFLNPVRVICAREDAKLLFAHKVPSDLRSCAQMVNRLDRGGNCVPRTVSVLHLLYSERGLLYRRQLNRLFLFINHQEKHCSDKFMSKVWRMKLRMCV